MSERTSTVTVCAALVLLGLGMAPMVYAVPIPSNATLPDGTPGFDLLGSQPGPIQSPAEFLVGFNSQTKPGPVNLPTLDLADAANPLLNNPDTGASFSLF